MAENEILNSEKEKFSEFDDVWNILPHFSVYQLLITGIAGYISMVGGLCALFPVFGQWSPPHRCRIPIHGAFSSLSFSQTADIQNALEIDKCEAVDFEISANCTDLFSDVKDLRECIKRELNGTKIETYNCEPGNFIYNMEAIGQSSDKKNSLFRSGHAWQTTVSAFDTVCSEKWLGSLMTSSGIIGQFTGAVFAGMYTDRFGRKNAILVFSALMALFSILQGVLNSELGFIFCRILVMACCQIAYIAALTYGVELTGPSKRSIPGSLINVYFSIGYSGISLVAWFIPDWQGLSVALGIFGAIQVFLCYFIPESPRFLAVKNKTDEAGSVLEALAAKTGIKLETRIVEELNGLTKFGEKNESETVKRTIADLFKTRLMRNVSLNIGFSFIVTTIVYYGLAYNVSSLSGDIYVNNFINGIIECFSYFVSIPLIDRFGRRFTTATMMYLGSTSLFFFMLAAQIESDSIFIRESGKWLAFFGKFCISAVFNNIFIWASELYPTEVRTVGVGFASMVGRVSGALSPFVLALQDKPGFGWLPYTIFALAGFSSATLMLKLPETNNANLTETIDEAEQFYKSCAKKCSSGR